MSETIAALCDQVAEAASEAIAWVGDPANAETVGAEAGPIKRMLRREALRAKNLAQAARRPMCVSVFGPSQAGKSFLVSVLARPAGGILTAAFPDPGGRLDFIKDINPEGEGESTGLVTRFTIDGYEAPAGFPVKLRLLSESDIARVLANTFLMDGDKSEAEPTPDEIDALFKRFRPLMGTQDAAGFGPEAMIAIQEYLTKNFGRTSPYVSQLQGFWEDAIEIAPRLSTADRAAFLAIVWGRHDTFTKLFVRLAKALEQLGHPLEAFAGLDALTPKADSIIDVKLLNGLDQEGGPEISLVAPSGKKASLAKSVVTALTAELVMPMVDKPHDLFAGTDLLDFPGARTRFEKPLDKFLTSASDPLKECLLRGKVAYLFDRYVAEQEITSMLLCIPPSNMEVADLPGLIADWINHTHGSSVQQRANADTLLFFVLTKFDMHLTDSAASGDDPGTRFERRMQASLLEKFAPMAESWPLSWTPGKPFDNCFWLRNPNFPAESAIEYDGLREVRHLPAKADRIAELKNGCINADLVRRHFRDPAAAWDAAMSLNDGGVSYLVEALTPVCRPEIKQRQIAAQLHEAAQRLSTAVARFHVSDNLGKRLEERRQAAQALMAELLTVHNQRLFGALIWELAVAAEVVFDRMRRPPANVRLVAARTKQPLTETAAGNGGGGIVVPGGITLPGGTPSPSRPGPAAAPGLVAGRAERMRTLARADWRAEAAFAAWVERLKAFASAEDIEQRLALSPSAASELTGELIVAARRIRLEITIADELDRVAHHEQGDSALLSAAMLATERLNAFTATAAATFVEPARRPEVVLGDSRRKPFEAAAQHAGPDDLPAVPRRADADYLTNWMHMIYAQFEENAKDVGGSSVDHEQNQRLGTILEQLAAA